MMKKRYFSLIELLIVVGILGALSALILPMFHDTEKEAKDTVARTKMKDIQRAFGRFHADMLNEMRKKNASDSNPYLEDIALYGLWPLFVRNHPVLSSGEAAVYPAYDAERRFGWRGQYLEYDGVTQIAAPTLTSAQNAGSDCRIPVLRDPYGGYYRVLCPAMRSKSAGGNELELFERLKRMVIVCTGPNKILDTASDSFIDKDDEKYIQSLNGDDITAQGDDIVMRLIPTNY